MRRIPIFELGFALMMSLFLSAVILKAKAFSDRVEGEALVLAETVDAVETEVDTDIIDVNGEALRTDINFNVVDTMPIFFNKNVGNTSKKQYPKSFNTLVDDHSLLSMNNYNLSIPFKERVGTLVPTLPPTPTVVNSPLGGNPPSPYARARAPGLDYNI